jgi:NTP pyrophosphatase (non-canonical NTP hydrolase)
MDINYYTKEIRKFAIYPSASAGTLQELMYLGLGLGEAGEIQGKIKKLYRDGDTVEARKLLEKEIGDCFWYLCRMADCLGIEPGTILMNNYNKLQDRMERGVIKGNGDER